jgi:hypothetical protein
MKLIISMATLTLLVGCAGQPYAWEKLGATRDQFNEDSYRCSQEAYRAAPPAPRYDSATTYDSSTVATPGALAFASGQRQTQLTTTDASADSRNAMKFQCMRAAGYAWVPVQAATTTTTTRAPIPAAAPPKKQYRWFRTAAATQLFAQAADQCKLASVEAFPYVQPIQPARRLARENFYTQCLTSHGFDLRDVPLP